GEERRLDSVRQHALARDRSRATRLSRNAAGDVRRRRVAAVAKFAGRLGGRPRREWRRLESREHASDDVARSIVAGPPAAGREPRFVIPDDDRTVAVEAE